MGKVLRVRDLMTEAVVTLQVGDTLADAEETMHRAHVRHLPVTDGREQLVGLVTHRMLLSAWLGHGDPDHEDHAKIAREVPVDMLMQRDVVTIGGDAPAAEAARMIEERQIGCLPVLETDGRLIGMLTEGDFVRFARVYLEHAAERASHA